MLKIDLKTLWYDLLEMLVMIGGYTGTFMVWMSMIAGCVLLWYFVFIFIIFN